MSDSSTPGEELSNADATSTDERPRKYLRRNNVRISVYFFKYLFEKLILFFFSFVVVQDISIGVVSIDKKPC